MNWFKQEKHERLKQQLKDSKADFVFDKAGIKNHLMHSIASYKQSPAIMLPAKRAGIPLWGKAFAVITLFASSATLTFADSSKPGDTLFFLDKIQEQTVMALPLPSQQKAGIQAKIVTERVNELQKLKAAPNRNDIKAKAIEESEISVTKALESVTEVKVKLESRGKTKQAEKINDVLIKLDGLADKNEEEIEDIKKKWRENKNQEKNIEKADKSLNEIKRVRLKLKLDSEKRNLDNDRSDSEKRNFIRDNE